MHFNLDNKKYSFTLKTKEKKEKECRANALPAHTLSSNQVYFVVLVFRWSEETPTCIKTSTRLNAILFNFENFL